MNLDENPSREFSVHCSVCLNKGSERVAATRMVGGFLFCDAHTLKELQQVFVDRGHTA